MKKQDLRVVKTTRAIRNAFLKQICITPVNKITVTGLAKQAEINKGTFYLHYADIFALYDEILEEIVHGIVNKYNPYPNFLDDPEEFVRKFLFANIKPPTKIETAMLKAENLRFSTKYPALFVNAFMKKLYACSKLTSCEENDLKLEYMLNGMLSLLVRANPVTCCDTCGKSFVIDFLAGSIRQLFLLNLP